MNNLQDNFKIRTEIDEEKALSFILNNDYKGMMYRWGAGSILHLLKWYEFIEYYEGCLLIEQAITKHNSLADDNLPLRLDS